MATAAADLESEYQELVDRLWDVSRVADGEEFHSLTSDSLWARSSSKDDSWQDFRVEASRRLKRTSASTFQRRATLGIVMARLRGVEFDDAASLIGTSPQRLTAWLHGEMTIPRSKEGRLNQLADVIRVLWQVLEPTATGRWFETAVPDLDGMTPLEAFRRNLGSQVERVVRSYLDTSFS